MVKAVLVYLKNIEKLRAVLRLSAVLSPTKPANPHMAATWSKNRNFMVFKPKPAAKLRMFAFPPVGGGSSSFPFLHPAKRLCPDYINPAVLVLPGRMGHPKGDLMDDPKTAIPALVDDIEPFIKDMPFAFIGMSLGGLLAWQIYLELRRRDLPLPVHFFIGGKQAPHTDVLLGGTYTAEHLLSDPDLKLILRKYGGTPDELLDNVEFMKAYIPALRSDFKLNYTIHEKYSGNVDSIKDEDKISTPLTIWHGDADAFVKEHYAREWTPYTTEESSFTVLTGGHYFFIDNPSFPKLFFEAVEKLKF